MYVHLGTIWGHLPSSSILEISIMIAVHWYNYYKMSSIYEIKSDVDLEI